MRRPLLLAAGLVLGVVLALVLLQRGEPGEVPTVPAAPGQPGDAVPDPFAWRPDREEELVRRAAAGTSHLLYRLSPGGAAASAERTARWRPAIEQAADAAGVDADMLEGLVFLESAGREDAVTPFGLEGAVGLTQILAETAQNLLGMRVDVAASRRYTRRIERARRHGREQRAQALELARRRVDERFDGAKALAAAARYLKLARERFGREDLAFVSYHMGIGNLEGVLRAFGGGERSYAEVYFDSTPTRHAGAFARLSGLGDDSANYVWKVGAGREILRLWREDRAELDRLALLHAAKHSAEEVLHPSGSVPRFGDAEDLRHAYDRGDVVALPDDPATTGLHVDRRMGELSRRLGQPPSLYRGLRPEALAMALYIGAQVRAIGGDAPLTITSSVRDEAYQRLLVRHNREATRNYSLHTTGWAFDVARRYRSGRQARAFQFVLDRLQVLNTIAWVREPGAIHITAAPGARALLPLLERLR